MTGVEAGVLWVSGLPASGKTTLAHQVVDTLRRRGIEAALVDSDEVREVLTPSPTFRGQERRMVYRSIAHAAKGLSSEGIVAVVAATAHSHGLQEEAEAICGQLYWVLADCPQPICERRDPKGLYRKARADPENTLPGVGLPYEPPPAPLVVATEEPVPGDVVELLVDTFLQWQRRTKEAASQE